MNNMYALYVRGRRDPILVADSFGKRVQQQWVEDALPQRIEAEGIVFNSSAITRIEPNYREDQTDKHAIEAGMDTITKSWEDHQQLLFKRRQMPPHERAKDLNIAHHVWYAHTGERIPKDKQQAILDRQEQYFVDNPHRAWANPICYKDLIPKAKEVKMERPFPLKNLISEHAMRVVERVLANDF